MVAEVLPAGAGSSGTRRPSSRARARRAAAVLGDADDLVSRDERQLRVGKLTVDDVQVGPAHSAGAHLEQHLARPRSGSGPPPRGAACPGVSSTIALTAGCGRRCLNRGVDPAVVAARARTENFPVASLLFPRALRPHLRAVYGFARLVDILGDEAEGDRLALLDELERRGRRLLRRARRRGR